ncbi:MAG: hypothetical protein R3E53_05685 [Myxococcota bacterium]
MLIAQFPLREEHCPPAHPALQALVWHPGDRGLATLLPGRAVVISGHLHIPCTRYVDGVRFEEVSLGYPEQWKMRESWRGWRLEDHLRQILPAPAEDAGDPLRDYQPDR